MASEPEMAGLTDRPQLRLVRNTPPEEPAGEPVGEHGGGHSAQHSAQRTAQRTGERTGEWTGQPTGGRQRTGQRGGARSLLRADPSGRVDAYDDAGTGHSMAKTTTAPPPMMLRTLTARPTHTTRATAKTISKVCPEVVVPAAADPAVLVHVHGDLRLSLTQLASETDTTLAPQYVVTRLATGCVDLAPYDPATYDDTDSAPDMADSFDDGPAGFLMLRTDARSRLALTRGILHRLAVPVGAKVLVTLAPRTGTLRLLNLGTLADAVETCLTDTPATDTTATDTVDAVADMAGDMVGVMVERHAVGSQTSSRLGRFS